MTVDSDASVDKKQRYIAEFLTKNFRIFDFDTARVLPFWMRYKENIKLTLMFLPKLLQTQVKAFCCCYFFCQTIGAKYLWSRYLARFQFLNLSPSWLSSKKMFQLCFGYKDAIVVGDKRTKFPSFLQFLIKNNKSFEGAPNTQKRFCQHF